MVALTLAHPAYRTMTVIRGTSCRSYRSPNVAARNYMTIRKHSGVRTESSRCIVGQFVLGTVDTKADRFRMAEEIR